MNLLGLKRLTMNARPKVLWVDDEIFLITGHIEQLELDGYSVEHAHTLKEAKELVPRIKPDLVIIDIMMPSGEAGDEVQTHGGYRSGFVLAKWLKEHFPGIPFLGCSGNCSVEACDFFAEHGAGLLPKPLHPGELIAAVNRAIQRVPFVKHCKVFIVHGHDDVMKLALKNYVQNVLHFPEPIILHEQPSLGRTIIEKFEDESRAVQVVFVLMTPDDKMSISADSNIAKRRTRQNVIFELGYFLGRLRRRSGRVLLLHKGPLELPSDINGIVYIDISNGIESAGEEIRRELRDMIAAP
jgi:CheY-like chemotaxis protein